MGGVLNYVLFWITNGDKECLHFFVELFFKIIVISFFKQFFSIHQQNVNCHGFFVQAIYKNPSVTWKPPKSTPIHQIRGLPRNQKKSRKEKVFFVPFWRPSSGRFHVESRGNNFEILSHQPFVLPIAWHVWRGPLRVLPLSSNTRSSWSISFLVKQVQGNFPIESICLILQGKMIRDPLCFFLQLDSKLEIHHFPPNMSHIGPGKSGEIFQKNLLPGEDAGFVPLPTDHRNVGPFGRQSRSGWGGDLCHRKKKTHTKVPLKCDYNGSVENLEQTLGL